ncbi:uncharacterized protein PV09_05056 [Verruconis gallopava]|uniref:tRNA/rRNA methyltransferase SpoU type domain-containing protein n=1 Tax=Verruconis gallopava TaxID=253628 RepID=A0A0D2AX36_9PEZI|nr:uncharacterized protein PV09_05056 [Verruconis gallopava]KIW03749.1 hypothetical protein PV09_05056 [Verruconis gallopava]
MTDHIHPVELSDFTISVDIEDEASGFSHINEDAALAKNSPAPNLVGSVSAETIYAETVNFLAGGRVHEALSIWMKWIVLPGPESKKQLPDPKSYFGTLINAMMQSRHSNHQKFCLAILRASVEILSDDINVEVMQYEHSQRKEYLGAYEEYCSLFEIIVMGRYLNQVQECLDLLPSASKGRTSLVCDVWWWLLMRAALDSNNEQVRKLIGTWLLDKYIVNAASEECIMLAQAAFFDSLLDWATNGQLASKSCIRSGTTVVSKHGELLSIYCEKQAERNPTFVEHTYHWLSARTDILNQHTTVFILRGLRKAPATISICKNAIRVANTIQFSPLLRCITRSYCFKVVDQYLSGDNERDEQIIRGFENLRVQIERSRDLLDGEIGPLLLANKHSPGNHHAVLSRMRAAGHVEINEQGITIDWDRIARHHLHQCLWRLFADSWPFWVTYVSKDVHENSAVDFAASCIFNFSSLARRKPYLWNTTARTLRKLSFENPAILQHPNIETMLLNFINDPPTPTPEHILDVAVAAGERDEKGEPLYNVYCDESLGHAYILDILARLKPEQSSWGLRLLDRVFEPWREQKGTIQASSKWKRTSQLQAIIVLLHSCVSSRSDIEKYYGTFYDLLAREPNPRYRFLFEWAILHFATQPSVARTYTDNVLKALEDADPSNPNPKLVASEIKIAVQLVLHSRHFDKDERVQQFERLLVILATLIASPRVLVRFEAQASFPTIFDHVRDAGLLDGMGCAPVFRSVYNFVTKLDKYQTPPESRVLSTFNINKDMNLATLFEGGHMYTPLIEPPLLRVQDLRDVLASDPPSLVEKRPEARLPIGSVDESVAQLIAKLATSSAAEQHEPASLTTSGATTGPLQTKSFAPDLSSLSLEPSQSPSKQGTGPILIGSLLDAPVNLGGLSRAANVFGCHSLHLPSLSLLANSSFQNVSVNSELHIDIQETKPADLLARLRQLKSDGWTIVGLEQTSDSRVIGVPDGGEKVLPKRSVVVMGAESTGIPADVLFECDVCVEIRQWGVTRSLNVQTAAACILFEWRREWGDGSCALGVNEKRAQTGTCD